MVNTKKTNSDLVDLYVMIDILKDENPLYRALGMMEMNNPSTHQGSEIVHDIILIKDKPILYPGRMYIDRSGTDFETNQPKYKTKSYFLQNQTL